MTRRIASPGPSQTENEILHQVSLARHASRVVDVTVTLAAPDAPHQDVVFAVWTPGSYLIREHERHVHDVTATIDGKPTAIEKVSKNVYRVANPGGAQLALRYEVYAHELTVRTSHLDDTHAFVNPVNFLPMFPGRERQRQVLRVVDRPRDWGVACALPEKDGAFVARDYDQLADSPFEAGLHAHPDQRDRFEVRGIPHEVVHWGRTPLDKRRFRDDLKKIAEAQAKLFGGLPYERYVFIVHASDTGRGGLEHRDCSALLYPRASVLKKDGYEDLLSLASHELFHAWNVKRIKPAAFAPYDFTRENHTRLLWWFEGITSYYEDLFLVRAGLLTPERYLEILSERFTQLERAPGRTRHPVQEASFDAWIRYYRQDENSENSSVSYYLKGSLVGLLLDLEIRRRTKSKASLDDVMRELWSRFGRDELGIPEEGIEAACERVAGTSLRRLFDGAVRGTAELPTKQALAAHGLALSRRVARGLDDKGSPFQKGDPLRCDIGLTVKNDADRARVSTVRRGSTAEAAALAPGDELVAIDGLRVTPQNAVARLADRAAGDKVRVSFFRRDELRETAITPGAPVADVLSVTTAKAATKGQRAARKAWLGKDLTER